MERRDEAGAETIAITELVNFDAKRVLDVGCGEGRLTTLAVDHGASVYAFDPYERGEAGAAARASS